MVIAPDLCAGGAAPGQIRGRSPSIGRAGKGVHAIVGLAIEARNVALADVLHAQRLDQVIN